MQGEDGKSCRAKAKTTTIKTKRTMTSQMCTRMFPMDHAKSVVRSACRYEYVFVKCSVVVWNTICLCTIFCMMVWHECDMIGLGLSSSIYLSIHKISRFPSIFQQTPANVPVVCLVSYVAKPPECVSWCRRNWRCPKTNPIRQCCVSTSFTTFVSAYPTTIDSSSILDLHRHMLWPTHHAVMLNDRARSRGLSIIVIVALTE
jgi:hypothetical protein